MLTSLAFIFLVGLVAAAICDHHSVKGRIVIRSV